MENPSSSYYGKRTNYTALFFSKDTLFCKKRSNVEKKSRKFKSFFGLKKEYKLEILFNHEEEIGNAFEDYDLLLKFYSKHLNIRPIGRKYTSIHETISFHTNSALELETETTNSEISLSVELEKYEKTDTLKCETKDDCLKSSFIYRLMKQRSRKKTWTKDKKSKIFSSHFGFVTKPKWLENIFDFLS
jgi:hypothetical protein